MTSQAVLTATDIRGGYLPGIDILHGISAEVHSSEIVTIIGPNGAGKSTFLKAVVGLLKPHTGTISFDSTDITGLAPHLLAQRGIGFVPQTDNVFPSLTVRENLEMGGYQMDPTDRDTRIGELQSRFPVLESFAPRRAGSLSGGQRQLLALSRALMPSPRLLCLDEPSAGLAPQAVEEIFDAVASIRDAGVAVLMVEQNATMALGISDRGYVLDGGVNAYEGRGADLLDDPKVIELYLGGGSRS
ncbi:MAG: ABC transporter ATP-binding protein [Actinomycetia bacterium]|nr:ABC transporter ATP-binding protein [Actinomycetes bacterium]